MTYAPLGTARYRFLAENAGETLVIPAQRNVFVMLFLAVWLGGWTVGGIAAMRELFVQFHPFLAFWLVAWALGWGGASTVLAWMLTGKEMVRMAGGDLELGYSVLGFARRRLYRGADVKNLMAAPNGGLWQARQMPALPMFSSSRGSVQFSYGARTQSFGFGLDGTEAAQIIAWLRKRLPDA